MERTEIKPKKHLAKQDVDNLAMSIGRFMMSFEETVQMLRWGIHHLCSMCEMDSGQITDILITDLSAEQLLKRYEALFTYYKPLIEVGKVVKEHNNRSSDAVKLMKEIYNEVKDAMEQRNKVAHAHWFIQSGIIYKTNTMDVHKLIGRNDRVKKGMGITNAFDHLNVDPIEELNEWNKKMNETRGKMMKLSEYIHKSRIGKQ